MANAAETLINRIQPMLRARDISDRKFSMEITGKPDLLRDIQRRGHLPSAENLARMAQFLGTSTDWLIGNTAKNRSVLSEVSLSDRRLDWHGPQADEPGIPLVGTGDCAELQVTAETGEIISVERSSFDGDFHVRYLACPPALRGARDIYAIYFHGTSMLPRFEPGEVGIVDPRRPVGPGDYVVVQLRDNVSAIGNDNVSSTGSDDVTSVLVKRLVRQNHQEITLQQFNPPLIFTVERARVARLHRIMPQTELLI